MKDIGGGCGVVAPMIIVTAPVFWFRGLGIWGLGTGLVNCRAPVPNPVPLDLIKIPNPK